MLNTTLQTLVENKLRGRVMSIFTLMFLGLLPLGNLEVGYLTEHFSSGFAIRFGALIVFAFGLIIFLYRHRLRRSYQVYLHKSKH
ncbi:hypothetical protein A3F03_00885 [Candidatus Roizmanbacteria bacterium RIFCSPHIGHO2_12_FULL_41_11]|uniref:Uncharacterized protein n=1 Tax=Candidatus Roizmanbacteria bacterium RIFCSPHIGHO2_12_FULL_41_11 TaxID=1802052 RepID=A0A1F7I4X5_9BACT|nr:MAG: hypothetical protein A3F03_00885 [Candidatus Roizmanbacteria bacterium RIFCSPHIGHO2_12_FULL_41_11]